MGIGKRMGWERGCDGKGVGDRRGVKGDTQELRAGGQRDRLRGKGRGLEGWTVQWRSGVEGTAAPPLSPALTSA